MFDAGGVVVGYDVAPGPGAAALLAAADPAGLDTAELVDAIKGWDRLAAWAQARQARVLAELASRRPTLEIFDDGLPECGEASRWTVDEVSCACH